MATRPDRTAFVSRSVNPSGFEPAREATITRVFATQDRINRASAVSTEMGRVMRSLTPAATGVYPGEIGGRISAFDRAIPKADVVGAYRPQKTSEWLRDMARSALAPQAKLTEALSRSTRRGIGMGQQSSITARTAGVAGMRAGAPPAFGLAWAEQPQATRLFGHPRERYASHHVASAFWDLQARRRRWAIDAVTPRIRPLAGLRFEAPLPRISTDAFDGYRKTAARFELQLREFSRFVEIWESRALWFLMSGLGMSAARVLADLDPEEAEAAVLDAIEEVVLGGELVAALDVVITDHAPLLTRVPRHHIKTFLRKAGEGDWLTAVPPMMIGLEGVFRDTASDRRVITARGTSAKQPSRKVNSAEGVLRLLSADEDYEQFIVRRLFGGTGHRHRHGIAVDGEREQVLMGIIGLAGWIDEFLDLPATHTLARAVANRLPVCAERRHLQLGSI